MAKLCEGRIAIVTGAGRGIGREHALSLAAHGACVVVNDLGGARDGSGASAGPAEEVVATIRSAGGQAVVNADDVSDWGGAERLVRQAVDTFGGLDVLVNNAGILRDRMLVNMTEAEWDAVIKVHLKGTFAPAHFAATYWRDRSKAMGRGVDARLINTTSISGMFGNAGQTNYGAAKAGIAAFTIIAARELARYGVTVNAVAPGALTRMTEDQWVLRARLREAAHRLVTSLSLGQASEADREAMHPRWIAPIVTWLASRESSGVTGRIFEATGRLFAVAEGWHRGPGAEPVDDPTRLGPIVADLVARARKNSGMDGRELD
jgi:NAD(P)-dependent dehydrogenase (short-subunit alcohol dehydrogenase family)